VRSWYRERPLHLSRASGRSAGPRYPARPLIDQHVFQTAVLKRSAPRTLLISRFHVKPSPSLHIRRASAQSGLRCIVSSVILMRRCGGDAVTIPSEGVKPPAAWLRAEHRRPAHAIRSMTDFCSSRRNVCGTLASYSSLGDERYLPRGRPEHPVPARQDEPYEH